MRAEDVTPHVCNHEDPWRCTRPGHLMRAEDHVRPLRSDRHEKWQPVEPGHVIPAGQPYMFEVEDQTTGDYAVPDDGRGWFVDSSWRPPLELPKKPTWGMVISSDGPISVGKWVTSSRGELFDGRNQRSLSQSLIADFIPLTPEQVRRLEQSR